MYKTHKKKNHEIHHFLSPTSPRFNKQSESLHEVDIGHTTVVIRILINKANQNKTVLI